MASIRRVAAVTGLAAAAGALCGAVFGGALTLVAAVAEPGPVARIDLPWSLGFGVVLGAAGGAVLAPLAGWLLLRRVPIGHAIAGTGAGAAVGAALAALLAPSVTLPGALAGYVVGAVALRLAARRQPSSAQSAPDAPAG